MSDSDESMPGLVDAASSSDESDADEPVARAGGGARRRARAGGAPRASAAPPGHVAGLPQREEGRGPGPGAGGRGRGRRRLRRGQHAGPRAVELGGDSAAERAAAKSDESDDEPPAPTPAAAPSGALDLAEWSVRDLKKEMAAKGLSADGMVQEAELAGDGGETHDVDATWATDRLGLLGLGDIAHGAVPQMLDANADEHDTTRALVEAVVPEGDAREQFLMDLFERQRMRRERRAAAAGRRRGGGRRGGGRRRRRRARRGAREARRRQGGPRGVLGGPLRDTPLVAACRRDHTECAFHLLSAGADPDARADDGATPLGLAAVGGFHATAKTLLFDFSVDASVVEGRTIGEIASLYAACCPTREALAKGEDTVASNDTRDPRDVYATLFKVHTTTLTRTMRTWKADLEAVAKVRVQRVGLSLSYETALARAGADGGGATWTGTPLELAVRADKLRLVEVLLEHGAAVAGKRVVDVPLYDAMEARRFGKYLRGLADDEKDNLIARPGDVERGFEDLDTLCGNIGAATAPAEAARLRALAAGHDARGSGRDVSAEFERRRRRALLWRCSLLLARSGCGDVLSFVAAGQKKGGHIFANGDMPDGVKGLREAREALEKCASLAYQVAKEYEDFPTPPATTDDAEDALKARAAAVGKENPLGFDGKALAHAFQLVALQRLTNVVALEASLLTATNPSREGVADVIPGYLDAGGASASWLDAWLKAVKGNEAKSAARVATALATAVSKWRESAPRLRDLVAAADEGSEQTLSSWKSAAKLKDFRPAKLAVAVASQKPKAAAAAPAAPAAAAAADEPKPALTAKQREKEKKRAKKQKQREEAERQAREAEDARGGGGGEADRPPPAPRSSAARAAQEGARGPGEARGGGGQGARGARRPRAERARRRRARRAAEARDDAPRALAPAQTALAEVKARDLELKLKALPWATLVKRYGISVDEDELSGYERPTARPARWSPRWVARADAWRQAHVLVADRVLGWFADRDGAWRDRALDVLGAVARGPLADPLKGRARARACGPRALDGSMLLLYSAFKDASGAVGVLAWCAVRKANLNDFVEKILESLDRRGVSEDAGAVPDARADHVLLSPGKNTPMKLYVAACESLPGGRAPGAVKAAVGENRGTGKTVCMARRIARDRADHADRELLFVARSQALCNFVRTLACAGDADAASAAGERAAAKFLTVNDLLPLLEEKTKNMAAGCKSDANGNYSSENDTDSSDDDSSDDDDGAGARATQFGAMSFKAIQDGVAFRFSDLKETIYELQKE
ncbi:manganese ion binding protein [Aureococcus anophagefferens]|uniref:Manganese ion binding protein n=1 Tax=Aureococcus anophagefferens TaxID=44056 RepID=A0ABR1G2L5_AURAN